VIRPSRGYQLKYQLFLFYLICFVTSVLLGQSTNKFIDYKSLTKRVYNFTKVEFITEEGEFNDAICTLPIPDLSKDSPPFLAIYYKRTNSQWFTESLYRKRVRFSFRDGVIKLERSNFWDWHELEEIKIVVLY
jgi:hypothetical protein